MKRGAAQPGSHPARLSRLDFGSCGVVVSRIGQNGSLQSRRAGKARRSAPGTQHLALSSRGEL